MNRYKKVSFKEIKEYTPPGHDDTFNRRLIGPKDGAEHIEVIYGKMGKTGHAKAHFHSEFEQCMFVLSGQLKVTGDGDDVVLGKDDFIIFFKNSLHKVICQTDAATFLVIYTPARENSSEAVNQG